MLNRLLYRSCICLGAAACIAAAGLPNGLHNISAQEVTMNGVARNATSAENARSAATDSGANVPADQSAEGLEQEPVKLSVDVSARGEGYSAVLYDNTNGLPTAEANAIARTSDGFIWIGSYSGLIRYDGNNFERIDSTTGIASVVSLYVDSRDRLWIGTNDSGVAVMEKGSLKMYTKADGLLSSSIRSISEDDEGIIYIATTHGMARVDRDMKLTLFDEPQINDEYIRALRHGNEDTIYGVTADGDFFTIKNGRITGFYDGDKLGVPDIYSILPDPVNEGYVYIGTKESGIYHGSVKDGFKNPKVINVLPLEYINSLEYIDDQIWVCADNGIGMIKDGIFFRLDNLPIHSSAECLITDYQGNLWFTSSKQGVMKIVPNRFTDIYDRYGLEETVVNTTCMYDNCLFIGTKSEGLTIIGSTGMALDRFPVKEAVDNKNNKIKGDDLIKMLNGCRIRSIIKDSEGYLWISTYSDNALLRYKDGRVTRFSQATGLVSDRVRTVSERSDGAIMAACSGGLSVIKGDVVTESYNEETGLSNTEILTVAEGLNGEMLLGTDGDGIYAISDNSMVRYGIEAGLSSEVIMRIRKARSRDVYWIVTSNSIAFMDKDHNITTIREFPYSNNFDLLENSKGELWILSSNGVYVVPVNELLENGQINAVFFGIDNGLPCIATANSYSDLTDEGNLYIAGTTGVAKVNIEESFGNVNDVKMSVPYVSADGERVYPGADGRIVLPAGTHKLTIYDYVFTYSLMNPQVTYYLEGVDKEPMTVGRKDLKPADYNDLKGGNYRFVMKLQDSMGNGSKEMTVPIYKEPAFYEMPWFIVVTIAILGGLVYWLVQSYVSKRTEALLKKDQENRTFVREMTEAFAKTIDMKDKYTRGHSTRVAEYTAMLSKELGYDEDTVDKYYNIALLHDIGKIGVPPEVLNKPGKLTDEEFGIIKSHSALGFNALKDISIMPELAIGAGEHHERPDGKGYPRGLKGDQISRVAQIIGVADTFDAMYSDRPYRKRMNFEKAVSIISEASGTQLTTDVVDAFLRLVAQGEFRAPDDAGGGTMEDINNIHKKQDKEEEEKHREEEKKEQKDKEG